MNFKNKSDAVRDAAEGRWLDILGHLAPDLKDAIKARPNHVSCPKNGGKDGFRLFKDAGITGGGISNQDGAMPDGFSLLMWLFDENFSSILNDVGEYLNVDDWKNSNVQLKQVKQSNHYKEESLIDEPTLEKRRHNLREVWQNALPLHHPNAELARHYLASRGLELRVSDLQGLSKTMRLHRHLALWQDNHFLGYFPCLVSLVSYDDGKPATIHRTYLDANGRKLTKAKGIQVNAKKIMSSCSNKKISGGAIRLGRPVGGVLNVCEGIETALSIMIAKRQAVWPCISSTILSKFEPPEGITHINVWADKDREKNGKCAGYDHAIKLFERMDKKGVVVHILLPNEDIPEGAKSVDWNDTLNTQGVQGFPKTSHFSYM